MTPSARGQEAIEIEEMEDHENGQCEGAPECAMCLDEIRAAKREQAQKAEQWAHRILNRIDEEEAIRRQSRRFVTRWHKSEDHDWNQECRDSHRK